MKLSELLNENDSITNIGTDRVIEMFDKIFNKKDIAFYEIMEIAQHLWQVLYKEKYQRECQVKKCRRCKRKFAASLTDGQTITIIEDPGHRKVDLCNQCSNEIAEDLEPEVLK